MVSCTGHPTGNTLCSKAGVYSAFRCLEIRRRGHGNDVIRASCTRDLLGLEVLRAGGDLNSQLPLGFLPGLGVIYTAFLPEDECLLLGVTRITPYVTSISSGLAARNDVPSRPM